MATASPTASPTTASRASADDDGDESSGAGGNNTAAAAGIAVSVLVIAALAVSILVIWRRRRTGTIQAADISGGPGSASNTLEMQINPLHNQPMAAGSAGVGDRDRDGYMLFASADSGTAAYASAWSVGPNNYASLRTARNAEGGALQSGQSAGPCPRPPTSDSADLYAIPWDTQTYDTAAAGASAIVWDASMYETHADATPRPLWPQDDVVMK